MQMLTVREANADQKTWRLLDPKVRRIDENIYKVRSFKDREDNGWHTLTYFKELGGIVLCSCEDFFYNRSWQEQPLDTFIRDVLRNPLSDDKYKSQRYCKHTYFFINNMEAITHLPIVNMPNCPTCNSTKVVRAGHVETDDGKFDRFRCVEPERHPFEVVTRNGNLTLEFKQVSFKVRSIPNPLEKRT